MNPQGLRRIVRLAAVAAIVALAGGAVPAQESGRALRRDAVVRAVEKVGPAVVNISTEVVVKNPYADFFDPFEFFFGQGGRRGRIANSLGSGVIVAPDGYVLTNDHVIAAARKITVTLADQRQFDAELIGSDRTSDLAVLKLKGRESFPSVPMGRSDDLMIGETVIAIGNPFGLQNTVTTGVVSALGRTLAGPDETPYADFIQTDAAINPGNSGGALLNVLGELVGINTQIVARGQNLGFAIPIDRARKVYRELVTYGKVRPVFTGLVVEDLDPQDAKDLGWGDVKGVFVRKRLPDSPAIEADVRSGDVITAINGQRVTNVADYETALARANLGATVSVKILRDGREQTRSLAVRAFPKEKAADFAWNVLGLAVSTHRGAAVIDRVRADSAAEQIGLVPGLVVAEMNGQEIHGADSFLDAIPDAVYRRSVNMVVQTSDGYYRVSLPLTPVPGRGRSRR